MVQVIAFDLDDTLYKEVDYVHSGYRAVAASMDDPEAAYRILCTAFRSGENPFDALERKTGRKLPVAELVGIYRNHRPDIRLDRETEQVLEFLSGRYALALVTDGRSAGQRNKIEALGLARYFNADNVLISEETGADKTRPDNFLVLQSRYPEAGRFCYVGDNPAKDFVHPNRMGWTTVCLKDDGRNIHPQQLPSGLADAAPEWTVGSLRELIGIIEKES